MGAASLPSPPAHASEEIRITGALLPHKNIFPMNIISYFSTSLQTHDIGWRLYKHLHILLRVNTRRREALMKNNGKSHNLPLSWEAGGARDDAFKIYSNYIIIK